MSKIIPIDMLDPVDIAIMADPDVQKLMDHIEDHDEDYDTLFAGINESTDDEYEEDENDIIDTFDCIDDNSLDFLDMEADELIENVEDDDSDGELIDMAINGFTLD